MFSISNPQGKVMSQMMEKKQFCCLVKSKIDILAHLMKLITSFGRYKSLKIFTERLFYLHLKIIVLVGIKCLIQMQYLLALITCKASLEFLEGHLG